MNFRWLAIKCPFGARLPHTIRSSLREGGQAVELSDGRVKMEYGREKKRPIVSISMPGCSKNLYKVTLKPW